MKETGGPAFPTHGANDGDDPRNQILGGGMTLRDWFAGMALIGINAHYGVPTIKENHYKEAYQQADAMLAERIKNETN